MICGIIDMGANTVRLSIYRVEDGKVKLLINKKETAELSSYVENGVLSGAGMKKACHVLSDFQNILDNFGITDFYVFATASLRNIANTEEATQYIRRQTGLTVDVLSGDEEARLDFVGAIRTDGLRDGLLVDIGGGSTEIVEFANGNILSASSMPVGCLNLYLTHVKGVFPSNKRSREIRLDVLRELRKTGSVKKKGHKTLYGVGGTVRAAAKLNNEIFSLPQDNREISYENLNEILIMFKKSGQLALKTILRTNPDRVHTLIPGMIILKTVAKSCGCGIILANSFGIREGYLHSKVLGDA